MEIEQFKILMDTLQSLGSGAQFSFMAWLIKDLVADFIPVFVIVPIAWAVAKGIRSYSFGNRICCALNLDCDISKHREMVYELVMKHKGEI